MQTTIQAIVNQKGGVGKSFSCINIGVGLARAGKKVTPQQANNLETSRESRFQVVVVWCDSTYPCLLLGGTRKRNSRKPLA